MKIKFMMFLLALTMNVVAFANTTPTDDLISDEVQVESMSITLTVDSEWESTLPLILKNLPGEITCEVTVKLKLGTSGTGIESSFKIIGDCEEIFELAKQKIVELKEIMNLR